MFVKGKDRLLYLKVNNIYQPIGCLTSDSFSESAEMLGTTTRDNPNGWKTSIPTNQSFSCSFDGLITKDAVIPGLITYYDLKGLKRSRETLEFRLGNDEFFSAIIVSLSDSANVNEFNSFSGELRGVGVTRYNPYANIGLTQFIISSVEETTCPTYFIEDVDTIAYHDGVGAEPDYGDAIFIDGGITNYPSNSLPSRTYITHTQSIRIVGGRRVIITCK